MMTYKDALQNRRSNENSIWAPKTADKLALPFAAARIHDSFAQIRGPKHLNLKNASSFFCVGSCFAREVEDAIDSAGLNATTKSLFLEVMANRPDLFALESGVMGRPHAFLNRYNLGSMADLMQTLSGQRDEDSGLLYPAGDENYHDYHYTRQFQSRPLDTCQERRQIINETYRTAASQADVFVFTFGLCESFLDLNCTRYLNVTPDPKTAAKQDLKFKFLSFEENLKEGHRIIEAVLSMNPNAKIILTVSPVPLDVTFTEHDVVVANNLAKSTLVLTAHALAQHYAQCNYFPSFEMVMNSAQQQAWLWDRKHVAQPMVNHIMKSFIDQYIT